jgi:FkbM family methyltransferase
MFPAGALEMNNKQAAVLWWKQLLQELGTHASTDCENNLRPIRRSKSLVELFFSMLSSLEVKNLFEIGAHDAESSIRFVGMRPGTRAFAFEANPMVFKRVVKRGLPPGVRYVQYAVGLEKGAVRFFAPNDSGLEIWGSTVKRQGYDDVTEIEVPMITLDMALASAEIDATQRNSALWIDVEGTALDILKSGPLAISGNIGIIFMEVNDFSTFEGSATSVRIIELLLENGFTPIARDNEWYDAWNILFVHSSLHAEIQEVFARWSYKELEKISQGR